MEEDSALKIVADWHTALNEGQVERLVEMVRPDVEVGGPRGKTKGAGVVREWFGRANIRLWPLRYFARQDTVIVEERGEWIAPDSGQVTGSQSVATVFTVRDGLIAGILRYDNIETALKEGGLGWPDEILPA
jgi:ketosteroid isomerase-like protein